MALDYDAVVTLSGDGLIHEVLNGFAHHRQPTKAFAVPVVPCPCGSGNALSLNLLGIKVCISGRDLVDLCLTFAIGRL
jgi:sphingosine kinase